MVVICLDDSDDHEQVADDDEHVADDDEQVADNDEQVIDLCTPVPVAVPEPAVPEPAVPEPAVGIKRVIDLITPDTGEKEAVNNPALCNDCNGTMCSSGKQTQGSPIKRKKLYSVGMEGALDSHSQLMAIQRAQPIIRGGSSRDALAGSSRGALAGSSKGALAGSSRGALAGSSRDALAGSSRGALAGSSRGALAGSSRGALAGSSRDALAGSSEVDVDPLLQVHIGSPWAAPGAKSWSLWDQNDASTSVAVATLRETDSPLKPCNEALALVLPEDRTLVPRDQACDYICLMRSFFGGFVQLVEQTYKKNEPYHPKNLVRPDHFRKTFCRYAEEGAYALISAYFKNGFNTDDILDAVENGPVPYESLRKRVACAVFLIISQKFETRKMPHIMETCVRTFSRNQFEFGSQEEINGWKAFALCVNSAEKIIFARVGLCTGKSNFINTEAGDILSTRNPPMGDEAIKAFCTQKEFRDYVAQCYNTADIRVMLTGGKCRAVALACINMVDGVEMDAADKECQSVMKLLAKHGPLR